MKEVTGTIIIIISILLNIILIRDETRQSFISITKKLYKKDKLNDDINKLKELNTNELINIKYNYIKKAKISNNAGSGLKNFSMIITILISLVSITMPVTMQLNDNAVKTLENVLNHKIEIIKQKEITGNEKAEEIKLECNNLYDGGSNQIPVGGKMLTKLIAYAFNIVSCCIVLLGVILVGSNVYYNKASHYEVLVQYIDDELIKDSIS